MAKSKKKKSGSIITGIKKGKLTAGATRQQINARKTTSKAGKKSSRE